MNVEPSSPRPKPQMLGLAVASLVLSCSGVVFGPLVFGPFGFLLALLGVACGHSARRQIRRDSDFRGASVALAGLIVGYMFLAILLVIVLLMVLFVFLPIIVERFGS